MLIRSATDERDIPVEFQIHNRTDDPMVDSFNLMNSDRTIVIDTPSLFTNETGSIFYSSVISPAEAAATSKNIVTFQSSIYDTPIGTNALSPTSSKAAVDCMERKEFQEYTGRLALEMRNICLPEFRSRNADTTSHNLIWSLRKRNKNDQNAMASGNGNQNYSNPPEYSDVFSPFYETRRASISEQQNYVPSFFENATKEARQSDFYF